MFESMKAKTAFVGRRKAIFFQGSVLGCALGVFFGLWCCDCSWDGRGDV